MKSIRVNQFGGPEVLKLETAPDPEPGKGQILIRVHAAGVNPVDTYIRSGTYGPLNFPYTPGKDAAGVIEAMDEQVKQFRIGDRAYTSGSVTGTYAELTVCDAMDGHSLPKQISFSQGAALGVPYATAYRALFQRGKAVAAETVLIHGASGGVGLAAVQWARTAGLTVIGTAGTDEGHKLVSKQGAHHVLDHHAANYLEQAVGLNNGRGVDIILEMLANVNLGKDLPVLAKRGRVVVIGSRGKVEINPRDAMGRDANILGMTLFNVNDEDRASIHAALVAGLENGTLKPVVGKEMPLAEAARAHEAVLHAGAFGKIVLIP